MDEAHNTERIQRVHKPVLLQESVQFLNCKDHGLYVDCTLGMGGHAEKILEACSPNGTLLGMDRDEEAIRYSQERLRRFDPRVRLIHEDYRMLSRILEQTHSPNPFGILVDLGPSLLQLTSAERGFSFQTSGPLDMRMDRRQSVTAESLVNTSTYADLTRILKEFGEEKAASRIAKSILKEREKSPIRRTEELRRIVERVQPRKAGVRIHPATKTFQAFRIAVNQELEGLDAFIFDAFDALESGGRLVMIGFHSLEDRMVKQAFQFLSAACRCPKRILSCECGGRPLSILLTRKPVTPDEQEIAENPASRSAKLRAIEKIKGPTPRHLWHGWLEER